MAYRGSALGHLGDTQASQKESSGLAECEDEGTALDKRVRRLLLLSRSIVRVCLQARGVDHALDVLEWSAGVGNLRGKSGA